ncbi:MAG: photosystem I reaction center subunit VIII [Cyanobacteria bacterium P01_A01_bin.84]
MAASFLPSVLVPLVGLVFPAIGMAFMLVYMENDNIAS